MKDTITYPDFEKLELRIGTIVSATAPEWSKKLLRFEVDFGQGVGKRTIFSGIKKWYEPTDFVGKQFPFLLNLEPKKMGGEESQGMMLMADSMKDGDENSKPTLLALETPVENGTIVR